MIFLTDAEHAIVSPEGWRRLPSGRWVTALPLLDSTRHELFAHLDYEMLLEACERIGGRPISPEGVVELNAHGYRLKPETRPPGPSMSSLLVCDNHDRAVRAQLTAWDGAQPVANAGKPWVSGAQLGKSRLFGWGTKASSSSMAPDAFGEWLQPLQNAHNRRHVDYSSLCTLEADKDLGAGDLSAIIAPFAGLADVAATIRRAMPSFGSLSLGERCLYVARAELAQNIREVPGPKAHPRISEYLAGCRRGGSPRAGMPGHELEGGVTLGPSPSDENPWCAASGSMCTLMALQPGEEAPHGYRAAVWETVEDARALGRLRLAGEGYEPQLGDVIVSARGGGDPLRKGSGHYERVSKLSPLETIGGNELGDTWVKAPHAGEADPTFRAWIAVS